MGIKTELTRDEWVALIDSVCANLGATHNMADRIAKGQAEGCCFKHVTITLADGVRFHASADTYGSKGRLNVSPDYPSHARTSRGEVDTAVTIQRDFDRSIRYDSPAYGGITIAYSKPPAVIAKDIERRFLPTYRPLYAMALDYCAQCKASAEETLSTAERAKRAIMGISSPWFRIETTSDNMVHVRSHYLDIGIYEKLCELQRTLQSEEGN